MNVIVYGDFNCPYSYLASQRADLPGRAEVSVDWRAVEHDRGLPVTGSRSDADRAGWERELAEVASLALPGEQVPAGPPTLISNTGAAVAAYACRNRTGPRRPACGDRPGGLTSCQAPTRQAAVLFGPWHAAPGPPGLDRAQARVSDPGFVRVRTGDRDHCGSKTGRRLRCALNFYY